MSLFRRMFLIATWPARRSYALVRRFVLWVWSWVCLVAASLPWRTIALAGWPLIGIALIAYGAGRVHEPSGYIAAGSLMLLDMYYSRHLAHRVPPQ